MIRFLRVAASAIGLLALSATAQAQAPTAQPAAPPAAQASVREACMSSIMSLCAAQATSGDRAGIRACLIENLDKTSPECQAAVKAAAQSVQH